MPVRKRSSGQEPQFKQSKRQKIEHKDASAPEHQKQPSMEQNEDAVEIRHKVAMSTYRRYKPGLGHDGNGLYGALTSRSLSTIFGSLNVKGRRVIDVGAADGKVLLAALAHGANSAHGVEVAGDALVNKFDSMVEKLRTLGIVSSSQSAGLKCNINVASLPTGCDSIEKMLADCFPDEFADLVSDSSMAKSDVNSSKILVTAVWHGFNIEAKQALLKLLARSSCVDSFVVVGPQTFPYGRPQEILDFLIEEANCKWRPKVTSNAVVKLAGGGETYHAITVSIS